MSKIIEITVGAATSFNNPFESYANFKPSVTLKAQLDHGENFERAVASLQAEAQSLVMAERERILAELQRENDIDCAERNLDHWRNAVSNAEDIIANFPAKIAEQEQGSWEQRSLTEELNRAPAALEYARAQIAKAEARIAELTPKQAA